MIDLDKINWNEQNLVPVIAQDQNGAVLMLAYANHQSLQKTLETGYMHYWSRSKSKLWKKGETSGHTQRVRSLQLDCDNDAILARVEQTGPACHTNSDTCFGDRPRDILRELVEVFRDREAKPDPNSHASTLLSDLRRLRQKIGEEAVELALAEGREEQIAESADLVFHLLLYLHSQGISWGEIMAELERRRA